MIQKALKGRYIRVLMESEVLGKYEFDFFENEDLVGCYLKQKGHAMHYMFGLEKDMPFNDVIACCQRNILEYWEV